jgi:hypothetical protein
MNSRDKGKRGERELAHELQARGYSGARRSQQYCGANSDADVVDALPGIHIECKRVEKLNIYAAIEQAKNDCAPWNIPAVFHRRNREDWLVTMTLDGFMQIYKGLEATECTNAEIAER